MNANRRELREVLECGDGGGVESFLPYRLNPYRLNPSRRSRRKTAQTPRGACADDLRKRAVANLMDHFPEDV